MARACGSYPQCQGFKSLLRYYIGVSPSGKATDSDSVIRRFESCYPSFESLKRLSFFMYIYLETITRKKMELVKIFTKRVDKMKEGIYDNIS